METSVETAVLAHGQRFLGCLWAQFWCLKNMAGDVFEGQSANTLTQQVLDEEVFKHRQSIRTQVFTLLKYGMFKLYKGL